MNKILITDNVKTLAECNGISLSKHISTVSEVMSVKNPKLFFATAGSIIIDKILSDIKQYFTIEVYNDDSWLKLYNCELIKEGLDVDYNNLIIDEPYTFISRLYSFSNGKIYKSFKYTLSIDDLSPVEEYVGYS